MCSAFRWTVFLHGRSTQKQIDVASSLNIGSHRGVAIPTRGADLSSLYQVREYANEIVKHPLASKLELVIFNAGIARTAIRLTEDGLDTMMQVNCVSGALLESILVRNLSSISRVIHVSSLSSAASTFSLADSANLTLTVPQKFDDSAYGRTKLCQIAWAQHEPFRDSVTVVSVHPGGCATRMGGVSISEELPFPFIPGVYWRSVVRPAMMFVHSRLWLNPSFCADAILHAAFDRNATNGAFYG